MAGSSALTHLWWGEVPQRSGETPIQALRSFPRQLLGMYHTMLDEQVTKLQREALQRPYHVAMDGNRLLLTPPSLPTVSRLRQTRKSWAFSPGLAELTTYQGAERKTSVAYSVDGVEIGHEVWTNGKGVTDHLCITGTGYASKTVVALEYHRHLFDIQCPLRMGINRGISPFLAGPAAEAGLPKGVGVEFNSAIIETLAPTILALSRLITDTTGRPMTILVSACRAPVYGD